LPMYIGDSQYRHGSPTRLGVLVTNLGTPDAPRAGAVRRYLAEFLSDPRVIELPRLLWLPILYGVILPFRAPRSAHAYRKIWTEQGSPLLVNAQAQAAALQTALSARLPGPVTVALGMRYGNPSIASAMEALRAAGATRLLVVPLYPQYSGSTTGSTLDAINAVLARWRALPELRTVMRYHDAPGYIQALAASVREHWATHGHGQRLLFSFHGLPKRYLLAGDPYHCECLKTARLTAEALGLAPDAWAVAFQSRVGREEWLRPYTDETLAAWRDAKVGDIDVICPGFSADCLETLEEIAMQNAEAYAFGGASLRYIPCLNARPDHIEFLTALCLQHVQGWPEMLSAPDAAALAASATRAREAGAAR
jgi:ferrochelatase